MTRRMLAIICVAAAGGRATEPASHAQDRPEALPQMDAPAAPAPAPQETPGTPPTPAASAPAELTNAVNASAAPAVRDPFWPIGFAPSKPEVVAVSRPAAGKPVRPAPDWEAATRKLRVTGISEKKGTFFALLKNIGLVQAGEIIKVKDEIYVYTFRISAITASGIEHVRLEAQPIQR